MGFVVVVTGFLWFCLVYLRSEVRNLIPYVMGYLLAVDSISVDVSGVGNVGPSVLRVNG